GAAIGAVAANAFADDQSLAASEAQAAQAEEGKGDIPGWIWILLAAAVAFFIFRKMSAKKKVASNPFAPNSGAGNTAPFGQAPTAPRSGDSTNLFGQNVGGQTSSNNAPLGSAPVNNAPFGAAYTQSGSQLPDG